MFSHITIYTYTVASLIRAFYVLSTVIIILVRCVPALRERFLDYGPRDSVSADKRRSSVQEVYTLGHNSNPISRLLNNAALIKVPHTWFVHFYILSSICSSFWLWRFGSGDAGFHIVDIRLYPKPTLPSKANICMLLFAIQSLRRLYECIRISKPSRSTMWIGHYAIGMAFYFVTNIALWIEHGSPNRNKQSGNNRPWQPTLQVNARNIVDFAAFIVFVVASKLQFDYHRYLASLQKYTLPTWGRFATIIAPHYTAECAIYLALAVLSAPVGRYMNVTMLFALAFVVVNLGITADGAKAWMLMKFSDRSAEIRNRWRMIPYVW